MLSFTVATIMHQVCALARFARVGWEGFEHPPPSRDDVLNEIEKLDPNLKAVIEVCFSLRNCTSKTGKTCDSRLNNLKLF